jgi:diguanylate cyclase (GGDEF)-like protein
MFVAFGELLLLGYLLQLLIEVIAGEAGPEWLSWLTSAALVATAVVWYRGFLRDGYSGMDGVIDAATIFLVALNLTAAVGAADLVLARALLRSMSGSVTRKLLETAVGFGALAAGMVLSDLPTSRVVPRLAFLAPLLFALTLLFHVFVTKLAHYNRALERERVLTRVNNQLNSRLDATRICEITLEATTELVSSFAGGAVALGPADRLEVLATDDASKPVGTLLTYDGHKVGPALPGRASMPGAPSLADPSAAQPSHPAAAQAEPPPVPTLEATSGSYDARPYDVGPDGAPEAHEPEGRGAMELIMPITLRERFHGVLMLRSSSPVGPNLRGTLESLCNSAGLALATAELTADLTNLAFYDPLTRLSNRALLSDQTDKAVARAARSGTAVAMLVLDLNDFKRINDELGHRAGDEALVIVAARLLDQVREGDVVARIGGDEFAVLLTDLRDAEDATTVARRIVGALSWPLQVGEQPMPVGASVGVAVWSVDDDQDGDDGDNRAPPKLDPLLHDADIAMYMAKSKGTGYEVFKGAPQGWPWPRGGRDPRSRTGRQERRRRRPGQ